MSNISSAVLNGILEGMIVTLSEGKLGDLTILSKSYHRLKSVNVCGEDANLVAEILNELLSAMQNSSPEDLENLSLTYQRVAVFELDKQIKYYGEKA